MAAVSAKRSINTNEFNKVAAPGRSLTWIPLQEATRRVSMGLSVWRETSKKLTVCREKGKKLTVCRELFLFR